jgi:2-polyprenyl-3-methyl-5-hydroxy-6-metoxy-1,4-benzoquinol methylase
MGGGAPHAAAAAAAHPQPCPNRFGARAGASDARAEPDQKELQMSATQEQVLAGQAVYTKQTLRAYDFVVLTVSNALIWSCPTARILEHYNTYVSANHLDVGVGTGYFLDRCQYPAAKPRVGLMDLNPSALEFASRRIARYRPETYQRNVLEPVALEAPKFDSVGINYLLHCLPGTLESKAVVFDHVKALVHPDAVVFGSTILQGGVRRNAAARRLMEFYNRKGVFTNRHDSLDGLRSELKQRFKEVSVEVIGCVALFSGRV